MQEEPAASKSLLGRILCLYRPTICNMLCVLAAGRTKGRKKATGVRSVMHWDWDDQRDKVARSLASVTDIDLWKLYRPKPIEEALLQTCSRTVRSHAVRLHTLSCCHCQALQKELLPSGLRTGASAVPVPCTF